MVLVGWYDPRELVLTGWHIAACTNCSSSHVSRTFSLSNVCYKHHSKKIAKWIFVGLRKKTRAIFGHPLIWVLFFILFFGNDRSLVSWSSSLPMRINKDLNRGAGIDAVWLAAWLHAIGEFQICVSLERLVVGAKSRDFLDQQCVMRMKTIVLQYTESNGTPCLPTF